MLEQAVLAVVDPEKFEQFHALLNAAFAERDVEVLLDHVCRSRFGIRSFEAILERGWLGKQAAGLYSGLVVSDQALTRERYFELVEAVSLELRFRYRKAYAQY